MKARVRLYEKCSPHIQLQFAVGLCNNAEFHRNWRDVAAPGQELDSVVAQLCTTLDDLLRIRATCVGGVAIYLVLFFVSCFYFYLIIIFIFYICVMYIYIYLLLFDFYIYFIFIHFILFYLH